MTIFVTIGWIALVFMNLVPVATVKCVITTCVAVQKDAAL